MRRLGITLAVLFTACAAPNPSFDPMYPRTTQDCTLWVDGSYFPIGRTMLGKTDFGASPPRSDGTIPELEFVYFVDFFETIRLDSPLFTAVSHGGESIAKGRLYLVTNPHDNILSSAWPGGINSSPEIDQAIKPAMQRQQPEFLRGASVAELVGHRWSASF